MRSCQMSVSVQSACVSNHSTSRWEIAAAGPLIALRREDFLSAVTGVSRSLAEDTAATRLAFRG